MKKIISFILAFILCGSSLCLAGCGKETITESDDTFIYTLKQDGTWSIGAKDKTNLPEHLIIPEYYNGTPVTAISKEGFMSCKTLLSVTLSPQIKDWGESAFARCSKLTEVVLYPSFGGMNRYVFGACHNLTTITYHGTKAQWDNLLLSSAWIDSDINVVINCTDGQIRPNNKSNNFFDSIFD